MTEKIFFPGNRKEPHSAPPSRLAKSFFDVHIENMSPELREPLLRAMTDHGLTKDDPGLVFGMVFFSIQKCVSEIPAQAEAAVRLATERAAEKMAEQSARLFGNHAQMLEEHAGRLERATEEALRGYLVESAAALEARVLDGVERRLYAALAKNSILVAHESAAALRGALTRELADAGKEMKRLSETAQETRDTIRWLPWWLLALFGAACFALGWCARGGLGL